MEITPLGDSALIVRISENFESAQDETLSEVLAVQRRLETAQLPGVIEIAPAYTTVAVFFDPTRVVSGGAEPDRLFDSLAKRIREALSDTREVHHQLESRLIEVPVCYEAEFALDLEDGGGGEDLAGARCPEMHQHVEEPGVVLDARDR